MKKIEVKLEEIEIMEILQTLAFIYLDTHPLTGQIENCSTGKVYTPTEIIEISNRMIDVLRTHLNI